jgi:hypothetical protein
VAEGRSLGACSIWLCAVRVMTWALAWSVCSGYASDAPLFGGAFAVVGGLVVAVHYLIRWTVAAGRAATP